VLTRTALIQDIKEKLEQATNQGHRFIKPQRTRANTRESNLYLDWMMVGINIANTSSSCGTDGVHPSWIRVYDRQHKPHADRIKDILATSLNNPDFYSARPVLIPKKDGAWRPIMVLNNPLRYLEKGLLEELRKVKYQNADEIFSFVANKSTHDAYHELRVTLEEKRDTKVSF
jgi:hypothetical protein